MKVYVAGSSAEMERAKSASIWLMNHGFAVVSTWIQSIECNQNGIPNPRNAFTAQRRTWSEVDLEEVRSADLIWFLVPGPKYTTRGAWLEAGFSIALDKVIVFSGDTKSSIFCALGKEFDDDQDARHWITRLRDDRERQLDLPTIKAPQVGELDLRIAIPPVVEPVGASAADTARAANIENSRILELAVELERQLPSGAHINKSQLTPRYLEVVLAPDVYVTVAPSCIPDAPLTMTIYSFKEDPKALIPAHSTTFEGAVRTFGVFVAGMRAVS